MTGGAERAGGADVPGGSETIGGVEVPSGAETIGGVEVPSGAETTAGPVAAGPGRDRGSFTAELAAGLPAVVLFLLVGLTAVTAVTTRLRCVDAARDAALAASRGASGQDAARQHAPADATVTIVTVDGRVRATVSAPVRPLGAHLPTMDVTATAVAALEPGSAGVGR